MVIAVSTAMKKYINAAGVHDNKIAVIHNGVAISSLKKTKIRNKKYFDFVCVGLLRDRKGIDVLIQALSILINEMKLSIKLSLVGPFETDEYRALIVRLAEDLNVTSSIEMEGFRSDILGRIAEADCLVLPSLRGEGLPMVVLEAMSVGLPVVASDVEGVSEVIKDDKNGFLVQPGDIAALANAMAAIVQLDLTGNLHLYGENGKLSQENYFSDVIMASKLADVYNKIVG